MFREFDFPSANDGIPVKVREWTPNVAEPRALIQLVHGMGEHIARYEPFARYLADLGFVVFGNDHLGHGQTARTPEEIGHFADHHGWDDLVEDMRTLMAIERDRYPGLPCFLYGHSMGSFLARTYVIRHPDIHLDGMLLSGTNFMPRIATTVGLTLFSASRLLFGPRSRPVRLDKMIFGGYNRLFAPERTPRDWLTRDHAIVDMYMGDPLCGFVFTSAAFQDLMRGLIEIVRKDRIQQMDPALPVFLLCGEFDTVGGCGEGVRLTAEAFTKAGLRRPDVRVFPGARHEILNETNRDEVFGVVRDWLEDRLADRQTISR